MRTFEEIDADASGRPPFSNGFEGEAWMDANCLAPCKKDANGDCPIVLVAGLGSTPSEWTEVNPGGLGDRYQCSEFEPGGGI